MSLTAIFDALAAMTVQHNSTNVLTYSIDALPNSLPSADLPIRLLDGGDLTGLEWVTLGNVATNKAKLKWAITDTFYLQPVSQGSTLGTAAGELATYASAYVTALQAVKKIPTGAEITDAKGTIGVSEYPVGGGTFYYMYKIELEVQEVI